MKKGKFIVLEGIDGSGKSTQASFLHKKLNMNGVKCSLHAEPTQGSIGSLLRCYLKGEKKADELAVAALFTADRLDHITAAKGGIISELENGINVICDRYYFSSYAYNCHNHDIEKIIGMNHICAELLRPDLTVFIDIPVKTALQRLSHSRSSMDIYENEEYLSKVRSRYFNAFEHEKSTEKVTVITGNNAHEKTGKLIWEEIMKII